MRFVLEMTFVLVSCMLFIYAMTSCWIAFFIFFFV